MGGESLTMNDLILVREWDPETFHRRVLELEAQGYAARRETYRIIPDMDPQTGKIVHLYSIELCKTEERQNL